MSYCEELVVEDPTIGVHKRRDSGQGQDSDIYLALGTLRAQDSYVYRPWV